MIDSPLERYKGILATIAVTRPGLPIEEALVVAREVERQMTVRSWGAALEETGLEIVPDDETPVEIAAAWCREQQIVVDYVVGDKLINAIKEARGRSKMGLRAAKGACEYMREHLLP